MRIADICFLLFISTALSSSSRKGRKSGKRRGSTALSSSNRRRNNDGKRNRGVYAVKPGGVAKLSKESKDDEEEEKEKEVPMGPIYAQFFGFGGSSIAMVLPGIFLKLF